MLDRAHAVELRDAGARRADHRFAGGVGDKMHMKFAHNGPTYLHNRKTRSTLPLG
jgi:hypothetical protein